MDNKPLRRAIKIFGSQQRIATLLGVSRKTVNGWLNQFKRIPLHHVMCLEVLTNGEILAEEFLPHLKERIAEYKSFLIGRNCVDRIKPC